MEDAIIVMILLAIIGVAVVYIIKTKKCGAKCIGCPAAGNCSKKQNKRNSENCVK